MPHTSKKVMAKLNKLNYEFLHHFSYSLDLSASDCYLFSNMKENLFSPKKETCVKWGCPILEPFRSHIIWKVSKYYRAVVISVSLLKETVKTYKFHFWQKKSFLLLFLGLFTPCSIFNCNVLSFKLFVRFLIQCYIHYHAAFYCFITLTLSNFVVLLSLLIKNFT